MQSRGRIGRDQRGQEVREERGRKTQRGGGVVTGVTGTMMRRTSLAAAASLHVETGYVSRDGEVQSGDGVGGGARRAGKVWVERGSRIAGQADSQHPLPCFDVTISFFFFLDTPTFMSNDC